MSIRIFHFDEIPEAFKDTFIQLLEDVLSDEYKPVLGKKRGK